MSTHVTSELRKLLGLTQEQLANQCEEGKLRREEVVKVETGMNKLSTKAMRTKYASAFWITETELDLLLGGKLMPTELAARIKSRGKPPWSEPTFEPTRGSWGAHPQWPEKIDEAMRLFRRVVTPDIAEQLALQSGAAIPRNLTAQWILYQAEALREKLDSDGEL